MRQMTARLPDADHRRLRALAAALEMSRSDVIAQSLRALEATLPKDLRTIVEQLTLKSRTRKVSPTRTRRR